MKSREDILEILKRKASFFKKNGSTLSINLARTKLEREFNRHRSLKSGAIEEVKNCSNRSTSDWRPDVPGIPSMGHEVTGVNHNHRERNADPNSYDGGGNRSPAFVGFDDDGTAKVWMRGSTIKKPRSIRKYR